MQKVQGGFEELTLQLLASRFNNPNKERITLLKVKDLRHQVRHLALKRRHPLYQAERSPSLIYSSFRLALQRDNRNQHSRSEILDKCSAQRQGEWGADGTPEFDIFTGGELRSKFGDPPSYPCWKRKEQGKITQTQGMLGISVS
jgi:hypothetical protein